MYLLGMADQAGAYRRRSSSTTDTRLSRWSVRSAASTVLAFWRPIRFATTDNNWSSRFLQRRRAWSAISSAGRSVRSASLTPRPCILPKHRVQERLEHRLLAAPPGQVHPPEQRGLPPRQAILPTPTSSRRSEPPAAGLSSSRRGCIGSALNSRRSSLG